MALQHHALAAHTSDAVIAGRLVGDGHEAWAYKAEGGANVAFSYCGTSPDYAGLLLRVRKLRVTHANVLEPLDPTSDDARSQLLPHDPLRYARTVIAPLVGEEYIVPGLPCCVPAHFLEGLAGVLAAASGRPDKRLGDKLDVCAGSVVLMVDHSIVRCAKATACEVDLCLELKPKCGLLRTGAPVFSAAAEAAGSCAGITSSLSASGGHQAKSACHYCMTQVHRAVEMMPPGGGGPSATAKATQEIATAAAASISQFCPLHLFSEVEPCVQWALCSLVHSPQNNFRVFADGVPVYTSETRAVPPPQPRSRATPQQGASADATDPADHAEDSSQSVSGDKQTATMKSGRKDDLVPAATDAGSLRQRRGASARFTRRRWLDGGEDVAAVRDTQSSAECPPTRDPCGSPQWATLSTVLLHEFPLLTLLRDVWVRDGGSATSFASLAPAVLCVLISAILQREPVLRAIGNAQAVDAVGIAPVWRVYHTAADALLSPSPAAWDAAATHPDSGPTAPAPRPQPASRTQQEYAAAAPLVERALALLLLEEEGPGSGEPPSGPGSSSASSSLIVGATATASSAPAANPSEARLLAALRAAGITAADAGDVRRFMISTTAKDCSLLVALRGELQHAAGAPAPAADAAGELAIPLSALWSRSIELAVQEGEWGRASSSCETQTTPRSSASAQGLCVALRYSVAVVDVDPKPLARIPYYWAMEGTVREAFAAHGGGMHAATGKVCAAADGWA